MNSIALALPMPATAASLDHYIQAVQTFPMLSAEEETRLARRLRENDDVEAARTLVLSHLRLVVSIARNYLGYGLPQADLIQEGNIGLMKAVRRFDPDRGVRLVSFAIHWIKAEIHEYVLKNWRLVKIATTKAQRKLFFNLRSLKQGTGNLGEDEIRQMARLLGVKEAEVREMETRLAGPDMALEGPEDEDESFSPIAYLAAPNAEPSEVLETRRRDKLAGEDLNKALATLDDRSRRIIESRWLNDDAATLHELAAEYGVSAERIRQIEQKALLKLRSTMSS